jgi:hypothetical protein
MLSEKTKPLDGSGLYGIGSAEKPMMRRPLRWLVTTLVCTAPVVLEAKMVTVAPQNPAVVNCYPFGTGNLSTWPPYAGWIYKNLPPFTIERGDLLAFDLGLKNDIPMQIEIAMAATAANGSFQQGQPFVTLVSNTQSPSSLGDDVIGNFEVQYRVERRFTFAGGGLILRFANPSQAYTLDPPCDQVQVKASVSDPSGFFLFRVYNDRDGVAPWDAGENDNIGGFRVINLESDLPPWLPLPLLGGVLLGAGVLRLIRR